VSTPAMPDFSGETGTLSLTRVFDAPPAVVYRAFTDPDQLAQWFGPVGFTVPRDTVSIDASVGGHQRFVMISDEDESSRSPVDATFTEVVENELLVGEEGGMIMRLEFHPEGEKQTRLELRQGPLPVEILEGATLGWESSWTKLDALVTG
jgi:uncharacterized protein YndB with AHSA1/START domain